ncbi:uncharacterized protein LOC131671981 [Phymastichus coffea]|uniref:uncharacterized protein LOC131671981 n=1 Tax=Phymastichus coffea TaxID=108790 RepID=UPI00273CE875|nr:uncharacterized protein LOC131671981 [Phymastichus coffea]
MKRPKPQLLLAMVGCLVALVAPSKSISEPQVQSKYAAMDPSTAATTTTTTTTTTSATTTTTMTSDPLINSLENIVKRVKSMKEKLEKTLNDTASADVLDKSYHDFLVARGYSFAPGVGYHKLYLTELSWTEALHRCRQEKAHLAVVDSLAERKALGDLMRRKMATLQSVDNLKAYVGIHDYCKNGSWITIFFGVLADAEHIQWRKGASDKAGYTRHAEGSGPNCAIIDDQEYLSYVKCTEKQSFICEMESA